jgi:signal transduction histidine kinase
MESMGIRLRGHHNPRCIFPGGIDPMRGRWDDQDIDPATGEAPDEELEEASRRPRRRERRPRRALTPEERAYREAQARANAKLGFVSHLIAYGSVCTFLLLVAGFRSAFIVAMAWGIGVGSHYFAAMVAPGLRRRFIEREVRSEIQRSAPRERRHMESQHVRSLEELSASIAHEIRNPITAAKSLVQQMGEDPASGENVDYAKVAIEELDRVERSVAHLLRYAREEDLQLSDIRLDEVVESALESFRDRLAHSGVELVTDLGTDHVLRGDAEKLRRVLINLIGNALDALEGAGVAAPRIEVLAGENLAGSECWVRVRDNGPGISPETLARIFSPFYTSKDHGTGLGLAISKKVVDAHGGSIEASSQPGSGAEFTITIPKHEGTA